MCNQQTDLPTPNLFAETYGPGSRCIEHGRQWFQTMSGTNTTSAVYGGGCYQVWLCIKLTYTYVPTILLSLCYKIDLRFLYFSISTQTSLVTVVYTQLFIEKQ